MSIAERIERKRRAAKDYIATMSERDFLLWRDYRDACMSSDPSAVAFRIEVRMEHRRLARRRALTMAISQRTRATKAPRRPEGEAP